VIGELPRGASISPLEMMRFEKRKLTNESEERRAQAALEEAGWNESMN